MTTPTPRTDAIKKLFRDAINEPDRERQIAMREGAECGIEALERDLAAAREGLVRERMAQTNVEMAHAQEKNELRQQLAAAQEAIRISKDTIDCLNGAVEREQEDRDSARDRVKSLVLDLSAAVGRYQRAEERVRELENFADLMADEFQRIVVCCESGDTFVASEIIGLCQRAVKTTKQNVPVIVQRDRAEALAESYKATIDRARRVMGGEGVEDQGQAWDQCLRILDAAIDAAQEKP